MLKYSKVTLLTVVFETYYIVLITETDVYAVCGIYEMCGQHYIHRLIVQLFIAVCKSIELCIYCIRSVYTVIESV